MINFASGFIDVTNVCAQNQFTWIKFYHGLTNDVITIQDRAKRTEFYLTQCLFYNNLRRLARFWQEFHVFERFVVK